MGMKLEARELSGPQIVEIHKEFDINWQFVLFLEKHAAHK